MEASPVHLNRLRALPRDHCGCELLIVVTKTELTSVVGSKSQKGPFEGEEERVRTKGHSNEWAKAEKIESISWSNLFWHVTDTLITLRNHEF